jgi:hypothetical protein
MTKQMRLYLLVCMLGGLACQAQEDNRCNIIHTILTHEATRKVHYFDKIKANLVIVDTTQFFRNCPAEEHFGYKASVSHNTADADIKSPSHFVISVTRESRRKLAVVLHQKSRGAVSYFTLRERRGKYKVIRYDVGFF